MANNLLGTVSGQQTADSWLTGMDAGGLLGSIGEGVGDIFNTKNLKYALGGMAGAGLIGGLAGLGGSDNYTGGIEGQKSLVEDIRNMLETERAREFTPNRPGARNLINMIQSRQGQAQENIESQLSKRGIEGSESLLNELELGGLEATGRGLSQLESSFNRQQDQNILNLTQLLTSSQSALNQLLAQEQAMEQQQSQGIWQMITGLGGIGLKAALGSGGSD